MTSPSFSPPPNPAPVPTPVPCKTCGGSGVQTWFIPGWPRLVSHLCQCARDVR